MRGLPQQRLGAQDVGGEQFARRGQRARAPLDQLHSELMLDVGDMLGDRRLADAQFVRGPGKRTAAHETGESAEAGSQLHNFRLYHIGKIYIFLLTGGAPG